MVQKKRECKKGDRNKFGGGVEIRSLAIVKRQLVLSSAAYNTRKEMWSYIQFPTSMRLSTGPSFKRSTDLRGGKHKNFPKKTLWGKRHDIPSIALQQTE